MAWPLGGEQLPYFKPIHEENILYAFHMYEPYDYTNKKLNNGRYVYPGKIPASSDHSLREINKDCLQFQYLQSVLDWQEKYHIPSSRVFVEEFGGNRMTKGLDNYFRDLISIFNKNHWHWAFYSFREDTWDGMDYELGTKPLGAKYWDAVAKGEHPKMRRVQNNVWNTLYRSLDG
jgi:endoglucanase